MTHPKLIISIISFLLLILLPVTFLRYQALWLCPSGGWIGPIFSTARRTFEAGSRDSPGSPQEKAAGYEFAVNDAAAANRDIHFNAGGSTNAQADGITHDTNWHFYAVTFSGTTANFYKDAVDVTTNGAIGAVTAGTDILTIGGVLGSNFDGFIDEVRLSQIPRNACWIGGQYNNQFDPGDILAPGFYTVGGENETTATSAAITSTNPASLTESNLNGATVTVTLTNGTYNASLLAANFSLNGAPTGTTISSVSRDSLTQATLTLAFDGTDFETDATMSVTVLAAALATGTGPVTTGTVTMLLTLLMVGFLPPIPIT